MGKTRQFWQVTRVIRVQGKTRTCPLYHLGRSWLDLGPLLMNNPRGYCFTSVHKRGSHHWAGVPLCLTGTVSSGCLTRHPSGSRVGGRW